MDCPKEGDVLLIKVFVEEHPWGVEMVFFSPHFRSYLFPYQTICVRFLGYFGQMNTFILIGGWWIYFDVHPIEVEHALVSLHPIY